MHTRRAEGGPSSEAPLRGAACAFWPALSCSIWRAHPNLVRGTWPVTTSMRGSTRACLEGRRGRLKAALGPPEMPLGIRSLSLLTARPFPTHPKRRSPARAHTSLPCSLVSTASGSTHLERTPVGGGAMTAGVTVIEAWARVRAMGLWNSPDALALTNPHFPLLCPNRSRRLERGLRGLAWPPVTDGG